MSGRRRRCGIEDEAHDHRDLREFEGGEVDIVCRKDGRVAFEFAVGREVTAGIVQGYGHQWRRHFLVVVEGYLRL